MGVSIWRGVGTEIGGTKHRGASEEKEEEKLAPLCSGRVLVSFWRKYD